MDRIGGKIVSLLKSVTFTDLDKHTKLTAPSIHYKSVKFCNAAPGYCSCNNYNYKTGPKNLPGTNTLAYFASSSKTKTKFNNIGNLKLFELLLHLLGLLLERLGPALPELDLLVRTWKFRNRIHFCRLVRSAVIVDQSPSGRRSRRRHRLTFKRSS